MNFWKHLTVSFKPNYEIEDAESFIKFVSNEIKNKKAAYYEILDEQGDMVGGFRLTKNVITFFFLNKHLPEEEEIARKIFELLGSQDKIYIFTKERYTSIFRKTNFDVDHQRYSMIKKPLHAFYKITVPEEYSIRPFSKNMLPEVVKVLLDAYAGTLDEKIFGKSNEKQLLKSLKELVDGEVEDFTFLQKHSFLAYWRDEVVGVIMITYYMKSPLVYDMAVKKAHQGRGLGKALLQTAINSLSKEYNELVLYVTRGNTRAEKLYNSLGFKQLSDDLVALVKHN